MNTKKTLALCAITLFASQTYCTKQKSPEPKKFNVILGYKDNSNKFNTINQIMKVMKKNRIKRLLKTDMGKIKIKNEGPDSIELANNILLKELRKNPVNAIQRYGNNSWDSNTFKSYKYVIIDGNKIEVNKNTPPKKYFKINQQIQNLNLIPQKRKCKNNKNLHPEKYSNTNGYQ